MSPTNIVKLTVLALAIAPMMSQAATVAIDIDSGGKSLRNELNVALSGGSAAVNGDGTQVLLGYYSDGSVANPFGVAGSDAVSSFIALTGPGSPFGVNFTIGDQVANGAGNGELFVNAFGLNTGVADGLFPSSTSIPLVLRFFNASQTFMLDLSNTNGLWNWKLPDTPASTISLSLDSAGLVARATGLNARGTTSAAAANLQTLNPAPEPGTVGLLTLGLTALVARRRRAA
jgi:hypothetical protein